MEGGRGLQLVAQRMNATVERAMQRADLAEYANALGKALQQVGSATKAAWATGDPAEALANAVPYMQAFGHTAIAWMWLDVALAIAPDANEPAHVGRAGAMRYFFRYELPKIDAWLRVVATRDPTCARMPQEAF
jgi:butyryl-CoA dehydrogenase